MAATWNPVTGCAKISAGCENGCAERLALGLQAMALSSFMNDGQLAPS